MAALLGGCGANVSDSESSSSAEDLERFREAAWDLAGQRSAVVPPEPGSGGFGKDKLLPVQPSLSYITVLEDSSGPVWTSMQTADSEDDGFRLFSSSVPGDCGKSKPPLSARRQRPSSSSELDSDQEWQRYQEAAVSAADILKQSAFSVMPPDSSQVHKQECTEHNQKKKKKRKKKARGEHNSEQKTEGGDQISNKTLSSIDRKCKRQEGKCIADTTLPRVVKKKKKITRKEANDDSVL
ncbi:protein CUSTOS isoform X4 [Chrysemys picta bellii]|uniref:protein CUSTOS isoform X4 n=1 Tax=Chrysemys picta bellii TaxID=8478 RepID=UPI0032B1BFB5